MLLSKDFRLHVGENPSPPPAFPRGPVKVGFGMRTAAGPGGTRGGGDEDCRLCAFTGDLAVRLAGGPVGELVGPIGGFSHESEHDLAILVTDFWENGSGGAEPRYISDSESGFSDLHHLAERVLLFKRTMEQHESDLTSTVCSLMLSIEEKDLQFVNNGQCNASCIRQSLVKLLRFSGYDAAICSSKWPGVGRVPGGDHEYIDVLVTDNNGVFRQRMIIDIDFQSHFEIARAVKSYEAILCSLPVVYVGSVQRLEQFLQVMVEATRCSLKLNSMPLPPWRSLRYLQAKWQSPYERKPNPDEFSGCSSSSCDHEQCVAHLRRLKASLWSEMDMDMDRLLKPSVTGDKKRRVKPERRQRLSLLSS